MISFGNREACKSFRVDACAWNAIVTSTPRSEIFSFATCATKGPNSTALFFEGLFATWTGVAHNEENMCSKKTCKYFHKVNLSLKKCSFSLLLFLLLPTLLFADEQSLADDSIASERAQAVSSSIMSPYCPGRTLSSCPSGKAIELRKEIQTWFLDGLSEEAVEAKLSERFGDAISGKPAMSGFGVFAWFAPVLFFIGLLAIIFWRLKILRTSDATKVAMTAELTEEQQLAIDKELEERLLR